MIAQSCFHCGLPVPANSDYQIKIQGQQRAMCCPGCMAVADAIATGGLDNFYQFRSENATRPEPGRNQQFAAYDLPDVAGQFITAVNEDSNQICLIVGGITCAACSWLIEKYLLSLPFVTDVKVNVSAHRATVTWLKNQGRLSDILSAFTRIGYEALPAGDESARQLRQQENRRALLRLGVAGIGMMQAGMLAVSLYAGAMQGMDAAMETFLRWVSLMFATPVVFYSGWPFLRSALRCLKMRSLTMDVPVAIAALLAWSASCWATLQETGAVYFDSVSMFIFFLLLGRFLEMRVRHGNELLGEGLSHLLPAVALKLDDEGEQSVSVTQLHVGDRIRVASGEIFSVDGLILEGRSEVNEALLTGEQNPVLKEVGALVSAGSINGNSPLVVQVNALGASTRLSSIMSLVERAQSEKPPQQMLADKYAGYFVGAVLCIAVIVAIIWWVIDPQQALWVVLSVLVVTCPCALSLATPAALAVASSELRRNGFLITRGHVLETLAKANRVIFDKTGTLTMGKMEVLDVVVLGGQPRNSMLEIAAALEAGSTHPIAKAFVPWQNQLKASQIEHQLAAGVTGIIGGCEYGLGKPDFIRENFQLATPNQVLNFETQGNTVLLLAKSDQVLGLIILQDQLREGVRATVNQLKKRGLQAELLSGDNSGAVEFMAKSIGFTHYQGSNTPEQKLAHMQSLQAGGDTVVMVGDGINDVPVLSGADVSIAMGDASDLTRIHADSILLSGDFASLEKAFEVAVKTRTIIRQNMGWAVAYNLAALPLAVAGLVPPWAAAIGMSASSLVVVMNGLRLRNS